MIVWLSRLFYLCEYPGGGFLLGGVLLKTCTLDVELVPYLASIPRCIVISTGMPQKVRIVRSGSSLLVFYPHITIIKGDLCSQTSFRSRSGQRAPALVIPSLFIVTSVLVPVTSVFTLIMPSLMPVV